MSRARSSVLTAGIALVISIGGAPAATADPCEDVLGPGRTCEEIVDRVHQKASDECNALVTKIHPDAACDI